MANSGLEAAIEIGLFPASDFALDLVGTNERGEIIVDRHGKTGVRGVFAAGDVTDNSEKQIIISAGDCARHSYFGKDEWEADASGIKTVADFNNGIHFSGAIGRVAQSLNGEFELVLAVCPWQRGVRLITIDDRALLSVRNALN